MWKGCDSEHTGWDHIIFNMACARDHGVQDQAME